MSKLFIRYFAATDNSPLGDVALHYCKALLRIAPVRVASMTGGLGGAWERYATLLGTPLSDHFVNAVCCHPSAWTRIQRVEIPNVVDGKMVSIEKASQRMELYTHGVRNVLFVVDGPRALSPEADASALRYEALVFPSPDVAALWSAHHKWVIPVPVLDHASMRAAVVPSR